MSPVPRDPDIASILVVDDEPAALQAMGAMLADLGDVVLARSGADALRSCLERDFAIILLDVRMLGMDGFETAGLIRSRNASKSTPVIFLMTTIEYKSEMQELRAYEAGAVDYLMKPVDFDILRSKVAIFVDLYRQTRVISRQAAQLQELNETLESQVRQRTEELSRQAELVNIAKAAIVVRDLEGRVTFWSKGAQELYGWLRREEKHRLRGCLPSEAVGQPYRELLRPEPLRTILDGLLEGCQILGDDRRYLYVNDTAERQNRRPKAELLGRRYDDAWPGTEATKVYRLIRRCLEERENADFEHRFVFLDGSSGSFRVRIQRVPEGVLILSEDVTERRRSEQVARTQRDLGMAVAGASDIVAGAHLCLDAVIRASGMDAGGLYLLDAGSGSLELVAHQGLSPAFVSTVERYDAGTENVRMVQPRARRPPGALAGLRLDR
ncbi:MAG: response regulator, partial [Myxococcales bacterium]